MNNLVLHSVTKANLESLFAKPSHAVALIGRDGLGKGGVANSIAEKALEIKSGGLSVYPYHLNVEADKASITIEQVRNLQSFTELRVPRSSPINRTIIIKEADRLTREAQNALLKTLEEPPAGTMLILTANSSSSLLPTILSRLTIIEVKPPHKKDVETHLLGMGFSQEEINKVLVIANNRPGLALQILNDPEHTLLNAVTRARAFLTANQFARLVQVTNLSSTQQIALETVRIVQNMARLGVQKESGIKGKRWRAILVASEQAENELISKGQTKLVLTKLALQF